MIVLFCKQITNTNDKSRIQLQIRAIHNSDACYDRIHHVQLRNMVL